ncbi:MAG: response regulator [Scytolyngbya sp. HA4215-MV1]|jgi:diguanylate cyclase (GGDEF)-like protein|nr:response regulator [Scytolyngbya sp. HA4215-MV1]
MRILVVEDDELTAKALTTVLLQQNYAVDVAVDGWIAWELVESFVFDLILLDVMIPKLDGIALCRKLRSRGYQMPILLLTGRDSGHDKALGLDAGADDYVVKPFDPEELVARIRALLRRGPAVSQVVLEWGNLRLDPSACEAIYGEKLLSLTPKEYALMELFLRNNRRVFSCGVILEQIWSFDEMPGEEAVRTHIKGLRQKLKAVGAPADLIETVYGIGYRLKPLEVPNFSTEGETSPKTIEFQKPSKQQTLNILAKVWDKYQARVSQQVEVVERAIATLPHAIETPPGPTNPALPAIPTSSLAPAELTQLWQQARQEAHTLAGSLGTFGLAKGSKLARKIDHLLQQSLPFDSHQTTRLREFVIALRQEIEHFSNQENVDTPTRDEESRRLLIVDRDRLAAEQLLKEAETWGLQGIIASELTIAKSQIEQQPPVAVLLDLSIASNRQDSLALLEELSHRVPPIPVLILTTQDHLNDRLETARLGGRTFLQKPIAPVQVLTAVRQVLQPTAAEAKILVVDDDPAMLAALRTLLEPWGLQVTALSDPQQFWQMLEVTSPDLLILDIRMPHLSGFDLCQVVRNDARWSELPIIFLTAHTDAETVNQVFAVGADDFVSKPIVGPELVTRIVNRLDRMRALRRLTDTDLLTGIASRYRSTQDLDRLLRLANRHHQVLSFAVLAIDRFQQIHDREGIAIGDVILRRVGQLLQQNFRGEDVVARWGGSEFVLGLYNMRQENSLSRLTQLLALIGQQEIFAAPDRKLAITASVGVAQYPNIGKDLQSLYRAADEALYRAQASGGNRIIVANA